jgi:hypothetical protein
MTFHCCCRWLWFLYIFRASFFARVQYLHFIAVMYMETDAPKVNGDSQTHYGQNLVNGLKKEEEIEKAAVQKLSKEHDVVLKTFRLLIADLCQQFGGGHPGYGESSHAITEC